jgi:hypothetical protein
LEVIALKIEEEAVNNMKMYVREIGCEDGR